MHGRCVLHPCYRHPVPQRDACITHMGRRSAKIAGRKGKADEKRSKIYGTIGKKIIQYIKSGGPDPASNSLLADLLKQAKDAGCPKDIIERNTKKATDKSQADFQSCTYEAYGPAGSSFVIEALTDNVNRSVADVKSVITKAGCKVADPGSVMFAFSRAGQILVVNAGEEEVFEAAMEVGAEDIQPVEGGEDGSDGYKVFTSVPDFVSAKASLQQKGFKLAEEDSLLVYKANAPIEIEDDEAFSKCEALVDKLLALGDVDSVHTNVVGLD
eukprot:CAMPEP_0202367312 /NCGR_PEP_ID=MMETSP1126-20121109/17579_1 /ASSEMBLY_ACC=CAM_ASM_000457 /TAXON_ID=3047 /ORGANISM="Dunaliella tertiolecta, Strain CCMP1320" /LENGTH=269 /DNA_ID=CAMNT_0048962547 /DNA_START=109 /DNA_END=918 /DNA_ORIENTATION=+